MNLVTLSRVSVLLMSPSWTKQRSPKSLEITSTGIWGQEWNRPIRAIALTHTQYGNILLTLYGVDTKRLLLGVWNLLG